MVIDETLYIPINSCPICGSKDSKVIRTETNDFYGKNEIKKFFLFLMKKIQYLCSSANLVILLT